LFALNRSFLAFVIASVTCLSNLPEVANARADCSGPVSLAECAPQPRFRAQLDRFEGTGAINDLNLHSFETALTAQIVNPPGNVARVPAGGRAHVSGPVVASVACSRDDYAFLPPLSRAGLPCDSATTGSMPDPGRIARAMFDRLDLPSLRLNMNPRLGMVAVPTWFWVEGYDGDLVPLSDTLVVSHEECRRVVDRDPGGAPILGTDQSPSTHSECRTISDSLTVDVRVWPKAYTWSFGDDRAKTVQCAGIAACPQGIGLPFTDPRAPSPIAHAYQWSSLGRNGVADAYTIRLGITFGAQYRFSLNGRSSAGWQSLGDRDLAWSASHQVQEAQAVLTRP
jgi:hypothetical protein